MAEFQKNGFNAFTLAEVLITLGIIGTVCAMTIPNLMQDIQDAQLKTAWKKEFSTLLQAHKQVFNDNGGSITLDQYNTNGLLSKYYSQYLKYIGPIYFGGADYSWHKPYQIGIWGCYKYLNNASYDTADGQVCSSQNQNGASDAKNQLVSLLDGSTLGHQVTTSASMTCQAGVDCGNLFIDVNGPKGPNVIGRDMFGMTIVGDQLIPWGAQGSINPYDNSSSLYNSSYTCITDKTNAGYSSNNNHGIVCAAQFLYQ